MCPVFATMGDQDLIKGLAPSVSFHSADLRGAGGALMAGLLRELDHLLGTSPPHPLSRKSWLLLEESFGL